MKNKVTECIIPLASLKNGDHTFHFDLTGDLFTENQYVDIHSATLKADVNFNKNSSITMFHFNVNGTVSITCDRCGDDFDMPIHVKRDLIVKQSIEHSEEDDMVTLAGDEGDFDAAPYIYQYIVLAMPMQRTHTDIKACNTEALAKLKNIHVEKSNDEKYVMNSNMHFSNKEKPLKH